MTRKTEQQFLSWARRRLAFERPGASRGAMHVAGVFDYAAHVLERGRFDATTWLLDGKRLSEGLPVSHALAVTLAAPHVAERARDGDFENVYEARDAAREHGATLPHPGKLYAMVNISGPIQLAESLAAVVDAGTLLTAIEVAKYINRREATRRRRWSKGQRRWPDPQAKIGGGAFKPRLRVRADLDAITPRRKLVAVVREEMLDRRRPRPVPQLEDDRVECAGCGLRFSPGRGLGQDTLCPTCWHNEQESVYRPRRRRGMGPVPPAAFMRRGDFGADDGQRGPVKRVKTWGRRVFR